MSLAVAKLDDLSWRDLVEAVRDRIPAASAGNWTLHAPVDPGVTLLELFAWLLEQRLYWLDQVDDAYRLALLRMLDEAPRPAREATSVVVIGPEDPARTDAFTLASGETLTLFRRGDGLVFTTRESMLRLPIARLALDVDGLDRSGDLAGRRGVELFVSSGQVLTLTLFSAAPMPAGAVDSCALLFELDTVGEIPSQWSNLAVDGVDPPARLAWFYRTAAGFAPLQVEDGTGGLRRSGLVRFTPPADWAPGPVQLGEFPYALQIRAEDAGFTYPPWLRRIEANAVSVRHRTAIDLKGPVLNEQAAEWRPLPGQRLQLPDAARPPLAASLSLAIDEQDGQTQTWLPTDDLGRHRDQDRVFRVDRDRGQLIFGDGLTGRVPRVPMKNPKLALTGAAGGGEAGNLGSGLRWEALIDDPLAPGDDLPLRGRNPVVASGGSEAETPRDAVERIAAEGLLPQRAVTAADVERLARTTPGVAIRRAHAAIAFHPAFPCVPVPGATTVFIVPDAPRFEDAWQAEGRALVAAPVPDAGAVRAVRDRLDGARLLGSELFVLPPRYRPLSLAIEIAGAPADPTALEAALAWRLQVFLDPLIGGDDGEGRAFGDAVRPSALQRVAAEVLAGEGEILGVSAGLDGDPPAPACGDLALGRHDLVYLTGLSLVVRSPLAMGGLR